MNSAPSPIAFAVIALGLALFSGSVPSGWFRGLVIAGAVLMALFALIRLASDFRSKL